jgi:hypothetical protein
LAEQPQKESWWKSVPGLLTTATGFIAALSGLVAGLNQLGLSKRDQAAPHVVSAVAPRETTAARPAPVSGGSTSSARTPLEPGRSGSSTAPKAPSSTPAPAAAPRPALPAPPDTSAKGTRLPVGTTLTLTVPTRTCAPADGAKRFTARLVQPVLLDGAPVLPAGATAMLRVRRTGQGPQVRLDSLVAGRRTVEVSGAKVTLERGATNGDCLRANARMTATLGAPLLIASR